MPRPGWAFWFGLVLGGAVAASFLLPNYYLYLLSLAGVWAIAALGLNLLTGYSGQISIGHAGFVAIGAYTSALLRLKAGFPFWAALPVAGGVSALIGLGLGLPALRLRGPYLAIATLGFVVAVEQVLDKWIGVTGGFQGLKVPRPTLGPLEVADDRGLYALTLILTALMTWLAVNLVRSALGRAFIALRDNEVAAQAAGISLTRFKVLAFALSAFYGGIAGGLYAHLVGFISPPDFNLAVSIFLVSVIVVGGLASIPGTLVGAVFLTLFFQRLSGWRDLRSVIYGLGLILVVIFLPGGLWRGGQRIYSLWGRIHPGDRARDSATLSPPDPLPASLSLPTIG
jgi:branched-chain amino acid transport system permease protein